MRQRNRQSGFSAILVSFIVLAVTVLAVTGLVAYRHHKPSSTKSSAAASTTQTTTPPMNTATTQPAAATTQYLTIKEWGVKMPLSAKIEDAYYSVSTGSTDTNGQPNTMWLGVKSLNTGDCDSTKANSPTGITAIGALGRALPTDHDPVSQKPYTQLYPGIIVGQYYYFYLSGIKGKTCASQTLLQSVDSTFTTAVKSIVSDTTN